MLLYREKRHFHYLYARFFYTAANISCILSQRIRQFRKKKKVKWEIFLRITG